MLWWCVALVFTVLFERQCNGICQETFCSQFCIKGYQMSDTGCPTCQCLSDVNNDDANGPNCGIMTCLMNCPMGYGQENQCPTCNCGPENAVKATAANGVINKVGNSCPDNYCLAPCSNGYETDAEGCPICSCLESDSSASGDQPAEWKAALFKVMCRILGLTACQ